MFIMPFFVNVFRKFLTFTIIYIKIILTCLDKFQVKHNEVLSKIIKQRSYKR